MVLALHRAGLRVGMDVVYNHTSASGQNAKSVLDRIVPGYYQRLDATGRVEMSTCCDNTATENMMMEKLMSDSVLSWARHYRIDSFRFDLMGHQPRPAMERLRDALRRTAGRDIQLIGEGWNFGEVADGRRFVQASQLSLNGSGIGTFSDRARDAVRGGGPSDSGLDLFRRQGYINGLDYDRNAQAPAALPADELLKGADLVRVGLAGSLRDFPLQTFRGDTVAMSAIDYNGQPAGYVAQPPEVVNYVENHDNQTLYDSNVFKLPVATSTAERARVQILGLATTAFSQGVAYFHAGVDILRSKSLDRNSFDSGDWFNRLDWRYRDNYFGTGLPPKQDNGKDYELIRGLLDNPALRPTPEDIAWTRDAFRDLLRIRASSTLFRMRTAADIRQRLSFANTGPTQIPTVVAARLDGAGYPGANFRELVYLINVDLVPQQVAVDSVRGKAMVLHPVHLRADAADKRPISAARFDAATGLFTIPPRCAVVYVLP
jgi:pullulanase-type alpha-1,6-glucosidase